MLIAPLRRDALDLARERQRGGWISVTQDLIGSLWERRTPLTGLFMKTIRLE
jgi:hypothetical protein